MGIAAGQLIHPIVIQRPTLSTPNGYGERTDNWGDWFPCRARIETISGREFNFARSFAPTVSHKLTLHYQSGILTTHRVKYGSRIFAINAVIPDEETRSSVTLFCTEVPS